MNALRFGMPLSAVANTDGSPYSSLWQRTLIGPPLTLRRTLVPRIFRIISICGNKFLEGRQQVLATVIKPTPVTHKPHIGIEGAVTNCTKYLNIGVVVSPLSTRLNRQ